MAKIPMVDGYTLHTPRDFDPQVKANHFAQLKARKLRALASLGTSTPQIRRIAYQLDECGQSQAYNDLLLLAEKIDHAFEMIEVPTL